MEKSSCTLKDVARVAGVSVGTASKVINNIYVNKKSKEAVDRAVAELGYIPNALARGLKGSATKTIGVLFPDISSPINAKVLKGIEAASSELGYSVLFSDFNTNTDKVLEIIKLFSEKKVDGIIYASFTLDERIENALLDYACPVVSIMTGSKNNMFSSITIDNEQAAYDMTKCLIDKGHKKILLLAGMLRDQNAGIPRINGYKRALTENGIEVDENLIISGQYSFKRGYEDMNCALNEEKDFTAVFAVADTIAVGAMHAIHEKGLKIPEDISLAGFDGIEYADYVIPSLCTVEQPFSEFGDEAVKLLVDLIKKNVTNKNVRLEYKIKENESVKSI